MNKLMEKFILDAEDSSSTEEECETCPEPV